LHVMHASSKLLLCNIEKLAEFFGGYLDVVNHDFELGSGPEQGIDFCLMRPGMMQGVRPLTDEQIVLDRVVIGAVDNNVVQVQIAGRSVAAGTFNIDTAGAIMWSKNI